MNVETASPSEIDAQLAELYAAMNATGGRIALVASDLKRAAGFQAIRTRQGSRFEERLTDAEDVLRPLLASGDDMPARGYRADQVARLLAVVDEVRAERDRIEAAEAPLHAEYSRRGGWTRFFIAQSADGHIHSSMLCSTCNNGQEPTRFGWVTEFSGQDEAGIVALAADRACTVCYPSAPCVGTLDPRFRTEREIAAAARQAEAAAKLDAKRATAIFEDDPRRPLVLRDDAGRLEAEPKTIVAVERQYMALSEKAYVSGVRAERLERNDDARCQQQASNCRAMAGEDARMAGECLAALAARHGVDVDAQREVYAAKLAKKLTKAYAYA